jgi:hypothetical protein
MVAMLYVSAYLFSEQYQMIRLLKNPQVKTGLQALTMTVHIGVTGMRLSLHCEMYAAVAESNGVGL